MATAQTRLTTGRIAKSTFGCKHAMVNGVSAQSHGRNVNLKLTHVSLSFPQLISNTLRASGAETRVSKRAHRCHLGARSLNASSTCSGKLEARLVRVSGSGSAWRPFSWNRVPTTRVKVQAVENCSKWQGRVRLSSHAIEKCISRA